MLRLKNIIYLFLPLAVMASCQTVDLYEKTVAIKNHEWQSGFKPEFTFTVKDSVSPHTLFFVIRHNEKYNYNNLYANIYVKAPHSDSVIKIQKDLLLATNEKGWLGVGMDDIYEHRIKLGDAEPLKAGEYTFTLEQIMREDPLQNVLNVGIRIEK